MQTPEFWSKRGLLAALLAPAAWCYGAVAWWRQASAGQGAKAAVPVICIGNLVAGGAGKTPTAITIARQLRRLGAQPHFLTRGYGGRRTGPHRVDAKSDTAIDVGDEALVLAGHAPVWVARDRVAGARQAVEAGADVIVMDDGFQNPSLAKDLSIIVIDGAYGFGNGQLLPAGPLREPVARGLDRAQAVVIVGEDQFQFGPALKNHGLAVLEAAIEPQLEALVLEGQAVFAFAGIGRPVKFFETLTGLGAHVVGTKSFADHHRYQPLEIMDLAERASRAGGELVTTEKDWVRLPADARLMARPVRVNLVFRDPDALDALLMPVLNKKAEPAV